MKTIITLDSSQLVAYARCPRYWQYAYKERLKSPFVKTNAADKGTLVHLLLQIYYQSRALDPNTDPYSHGNAALDFFGKLVSVNKMKFTDSKNNDITAKTIEEIKMRFTQYVMSYAGKDFTVLTKDGKASVEIGFSKILFEDETKMFVVEGRIDFLATFNGVTLWGDHKTQAIANTLYRYKPQFLTYAWATGLKYGLINYFGFQKEFKENTLRRDLIYFEQWKIDEWEKQMKATFNYVYYDSLVAAQDANEEAPKNLFACSGVWDSRPCTFVRLCEEKEPAIIEGLKQNYYVKREKWSPWDLEESEVMEVMG